MNNKVLMYTFATPGPSQSFTPMVVLKGFEKIVEKDNKRFHELMNELKYECKKLEIHFEAEIWQFGDRKPEWLKEPQHSKFTMPFCHDDNKILKDRWICHKTDKENLQKIIAISVNGITTSEDNISYDNLLSEYIFDDGTKCGKPMINGDDIDFKRVKQ